jgi:hypothetical protein
MSKRVEVVKDVPDSDLARVKAEFEAAGATVTTQKQPNGLWTVTATFDDAGKAASAKAKMVPPKPSPKKIRGK